MITIRIKKTQKFLISYDTILGVHSLIKFIALKDSFPLEKWFKVSDVDPTIWAENKTNPNPWFIEIKVLAENWL